MLSCVGGRIVEVVGVLLAVIGDCLRVFFPCRASQLALIADIVVGGELSHQIFLADTVEVGVLEGVDGSEALSRIHPQQLLHEVDGPGGSLAQIPLFNRVQSVYLREFHTEEALVFQEGLIVVRREWPQALLNEEKLV